MFNNYRTYVSAAERRQRAKEAAEKMSKKGEKITPVRVNGRTIAKSFFVGAR